MFQLVLDSLIKKLLIVYIVLMVPSVLKLIFDTGLYKTRLQDTVANNSGPRWFKVLVVQIPNQIGRESNDLTLLAHSEVQGLWDLLVAHFVCFSNQVFLLSIPIQEHCKYFPLQSSTISNILIIFLLFFF